MAKKMTVAAAALVLKQTKHFIPLEKAKKMARKYQKNRKELMKAQEEGGTVPATFPSIGLSYSFNKEGIEKLLKMPNCVGIRIYPAVNDANEMTMVLMAFDKDGNNITVPPPAKTTKKGALKSGEGDDDPALDESQVNPPFPAPPLP